MDTSPSRFYSGLLVFLVAIWVATPLLPADQAALLQSALIVAALGVSFQIVFGILGQLSLGHSALFGTGAYVYAVLALGGASPWLATMAGALMGCVVGLLLASVTARLGGAYFAVVTYALASVIGLVVAASDMLGQSEGLVGVPTMLLISGARAQNQIALTAGAFAIVLIGFYTLWRSRLGWALEAARGSPALAASLGINVPQATIIATGIAGVFAGGVGAVFAQNARFVSPDVFSLYYIVTPLAAVVIGGTRSLSSALVGTIVVVVIPAELQLSPVLNQVVSGLLLVGFVVLLPGGLAGLFRKGKSVGSNLQEDFSGTSAADVGGKGGSPGVVLETRSVDVSYGANRAVRDVSIRIDAGEVVGLIGANGAGKSSLVNALSGLVPVMAGSVLISGVDLTSSGAHLRPRRGISRTFQNTSVAETLTVRQSVSLAAGCGRLRPFLTVPDGLVTDAISACGLVGMESRTVGELSYLHRRLVAIAMALAMRPAVVCLDEATAGLTAEERGKIGSMITNLARRRGIAFLVIEHDVEFVASISKRIVVMSEGAMISEGPPDLVLRDPGVVASYLGSSWNATAA